MADRQQVRANCSNEEEEEERPEPETSRSRRRLKDSNMSFGEMLEMVDILKRADYDGKYGPYPNPNIRKAKIIAKVVRSLHRNFGVRRSKDQLRKRWSDLKLREHEKYRKIRRVLQKRGHTGAPVYTIGGGYICEACTKQGRKDSEDTPHPRRPEPPPLEEGEIPPTQDEQEDEDVVELVTTTGDREVVDEDPFTSESAQILIGEIMGCNLQLEIIKQNINDVIPKYKNIIDVLGRV
ncbi:hypothetical protein AB205_0066700 [Aquarana catesbeiana]|uniref:Uncharacterized protein n=1 Tax=Aquarana catesbeiana TaxID=8400 RepID=A0A2G9Q6X4_AQUCT|nr:hypothetical protein AB205_0066700 [Aquarana catesbeiana]